MNYEIKQGDKRIVVGFHLAGSWEQTVKKGSERLVMWVDSRNIVPKEWVAAYHDNPDETPVEKLRCDTVVTVPNNFTLPESSGGVILTKISGGQYVVAVARVVGDDSTKPWYQFFSSLLWDSACEMLPKPCFEVYLNNGAEDGYWDTEIYVVVQPRHHQFISEWCVDAKTTLFPKAKRIRCAFQLFRPCREITLFPVCLSDNLEARLLADRCVMSAFNPH